MKINRRQVLTGKIYSSLFLFLLFGASCISTKIHGVQVEAAGSTFGYFKKAESCTPILKWRQSSEPGVTYDVAVHQSLGNPDQGTPLERGEQVFYQEGIAEPQVTISPNLEPKTKYLWSVRIRKPTGEVSEWSTYDKSVNLGIGFSDTTNFWFGIKTPDCMAGGPSHQKVGRADGIKPAYKFQKKSNFKEGEILKRLEDGEGGLILGNFNYGVIQVKPDLKHYHSLEEVITHETESLSPKRVPVFLYFVPPDDRKEIEISPNNENSFILMGPPGKYTLTRLVYSWGSGYAYSHRISSPVVLEAGKLIYGGDVISLAYKSPLHIYANANPYFRFRPEEFRKQMRLNLPSIDPYLVDGQIDLKSSQEVSN